MSGHSKWATIKRKKEKIDSARGKTFSKMIKEISIAARLGGGDEEGNPRLRTAVATAKAVNMPAANIERAIKKGTGQLPGVTYENITYEAYGPGGTALLIQTMTDNKNRTIGELRHMLTKHGGNLGESGSVAWMFTRKGQITLGVEGVDEDSLMMTALDAGADDMTKEEESFTVMTSPEMLEPVRAALEKGGFHIEEAVTAMIPQTYVPVEGTQARQLVRLMDALDEHDDVEEFWTNSDVNEESLEEE